MGDMLTQAEIDALLKGSGSTDTDTNADSNDGLSPEEKDTLGEIGNISMGTSATTLFTLLGHKVTITTPRVSVTTWGKMAEDYPKPYVGVKIEYTAGLIGSNLLILKEKDVKIITDLMMGGSGSNTTGDLSDLHLSAIGEAMNQMIGSSATSMSSMFEKKIDISPPSSFIMQFNNDELNQQFSPDEKIVKIAFKMVVGDLIDSEIMQILPISFAKSLVDNMLNAHTQQQQAQPQVKEKQAAPVATPQTQSSIQAQNIAYEEPQGGYQERPRRSAEPVNVRPAQFQSFEDSRTVYERKNIEMIMDVPLQVTVELGRTHKQIREILEFGQGSIIELDKLAGEPVDILVNGKNIAKGEVVVIDETFAVKITDILHPSKRL